MEMRTLRIPKSAKCLALLLLALVSFLVGYRYALPAIHRHLGFCPLTLSRFDQSKAIPIVYGLPTSDPLEEGKNGRLLWGGCVLGSTIAVCPHCHVSVKF